MHATLLYFTLTELVLRDVGRASLVVGFNPHRLNGCKGDELPRNGSHYLYGNISLFALALSHFISAISGNTPAGGGG